MIRTLLSKLPSLSKVLTFLLDTLLAFVIVTALLIITQTLPEYVTYLILGDTL